MPDDATNEISTVEDVLAQFDQAQEDEIQGADGLPPDYRIITRGPRKGHIEYMEERRENGDIIQEWFWLCTPVRVLSLTRSHQSDDWGRLLEIEDPDGNIKVWSMPAELLAADGREVRAELLRLGMSVSSKMGAKGRLTALLSNWKPDSRSRITDKLGWSNAACEHFVLGSGETISNPNATDQVVYQHANTHSVASEMYQQGGLGDWIENVSVKCVANPILMFGASVAFSGPLLELCNIESGGIHLRGDSGSGKSTAQEVATSVWGAPSYKQTWRATSNGLEGIAVCANGTILTLDELGQADPRDIGGTIYMLGNGRGKSRADRVGRSRKISTWKTNFLSSGEVSLRDMMAKAGQIPAPGQEVRFLDVQATDRRLGAIDMPHGYEISKEGSKHFVEELSRSTKLYFGSAGIEFVKAIVADVATARQQAENLINEFNTAAGVWLSDKNMDAESQVMRAINRIAVVVAGGELATQYNLTGWKTGDAKKAGLVFLETWIEGRGGSENMEATNAIRRVQNFILTHGEARFVDLNNIDPKANPVRDRAGWRDRDYFYIHSSAWKEIHAGSDLTFAAKALNEAGHLKAEGPKKLQIKVPSAAKAEGLRVYAVKLSILDTPDADINRKDINDVPF